MLKIRPAEVPPEKAKISFKLPLPTIGTLKTYLLAFKEIYGVVPDRDFVVDQILTGLFASDKDFAVFVKNGLEKTEKKGAFKEAAADAWVIARPNWAGKSILMQRTGFAPSLHQTGQHRPRDFPEDVARVAMSAGKEAMR